MPHKNFHFFSARGAEKFVNLGTDDINLMGEVGYDFTDSSVLAQLAGRGDVVVNINSRGGDYYQGLAIYNALKAHEGTVTTRVLGLAASSASIIFLGGKVREIARHASVMIHNASVTVKGDRKYLSGVLAKIAEIDGRISEIISSETGLTPEKIAEMMDAETYINSQEALDMGFAAAILADNADAGAPQNIADSQDLSDLLAELEELNKLI